MSFLAAGGEQLPREILTIIFPLEYWDLIRSNAEANGLDPYLVAALVIVQFSLGVANVALALPLPLAAAHNAGAALLLVALVVLNFFSFRGLRL